ncbi:MAG: EF-hand domain-containing protein [Pseudomonadota bacterium]|nr:EF-hand domain-containing protein [Pseudomonadota bacterium]
MLSTLSLTFRAIVALAFIGSAVAAAAQEEGGARGGQRVAKMQARFAAADANHDGRLTRDEAKSGMPFVYKHFDDIDKQKAGSITMADIAAYAREHRAAKQSGN